VIVMKKLAFVVAAASLFAIAPVANKFGAVGSSLALVWLGVLLAVCASGTLTSLAVAAGALGAFGSGVLGPISPAAAGAVLVALAFAERTVRVRSRTARAVHVTIALVGGALAGACSVAFASASLPVMAVSVVVASVLASLPLLVEADDPVAHALTEAASSVSEPAKASLLEGAELRRSAQEVPLDRDTRARVKKTWQSLLRLAEARVRLERTRPRVLVRVAETTTAGPASNTKPTTNDAVLGMVDQRIAEHVAVLGKAITAVDTAHAAAASIDDTALKNAEATAGTLEEVSRAMVEVDAPLEGPPAEPAARVA
jgi:hypothetical protein